MHNSELQFLREDEVRTVQGVIPNEAEGAVEESLDK